MINWFQKLNTAMIQANMYVVEKNDLNKEYLGWRPCDT